MMMMMMCSFIVRVCSLW